MAPKTDIEKMKLRLDWVYGITIPLLVLLISAMVRFEIMANINEEDIDKIRLDYTPLFVMEGICGSNDKLINILNILPETTKHDTRYLEAIKERNDFQREVLNRAALSKRSVTIIDK